MIDYLADAPSYDAWAGSGPLAEAIYQSGSAAIAEFQAAVNREVAAIVANGVDLDEALTAYDPERVAAHAAIL